MKILIAIDGSRFADAALHSIFEQIRRQETEIQILYVLDPPSPMVADKTPGYDPSVDADWWAAEKKEAQRLVDDGAKLLRSKGFNATARVEQGEPKSTILKTAQDWNADLIVLGSHGRKGLLEHLLIGSVSEAVARQAKCSVQIVRMPPTS